MKLLIVESPSKAKTIEKYLKGSSLFKKDNFLVRASVGHIRDLPKSNKKAIDIEAGFVPHYEISKGKENIVKELQDLAKKANEVILATDPDREGEAIAWHIKEILKNKKPKIKIEIKRVTFNEITKEAIEKSLQHPQDIDENLKIAQEARRVLDRLVGYDLSGIIWKKVRYGLSAGRVQSPALRIIMEREREIRNFIPEKYFKIFGDFETENKEKIKLECKEEPRDEKLVDKILKIGRKEKWLIKEVKESKQKRSPRAPFTTSTLQQTASSRLGYSPSRTMQVAQKLYEAGYITYMRTDSVSLSKNAQAQVLNIINKKYGKENAQIRMYKTKSKNAQEAHEAIRPTNISKESAGNSDQQKLYKLIWSRTVSSQMKDANLLRTKITAIIEEKEELPEFNVTGSRLISPGWLLADPLSRGEDVELPKCKEKEELKLINLEKVEKFTEPKRRYTEAGLIKELEARGIGRPSTYASTMRTLNTRGYVNKENKTLFPTDTGDVVSSFLEEHFPNYISDTFTAEMENKLDEIAMGKRKYIKTLKDFYTPFLKEVKSKDKLKKATNLGDAPENMKCPECKGKMIIKLGKTGKFYSCEKYPDCTGALLLNGTKLKGPKEIGEDCPECKNGKLVIREGRFGSFISCSKYPKCKFVKQDEEELKKKMTGVKCNICKKGEMMERRGRFGIFYSCSNYPDCKNAIKAKPTGATCKYCKSLMMEGTKTIPERCSNKLCKNHRPDKLEK